MAAPSSEPQRNIELIAKVAERIERRQQTQAQRPTGRAWEAPGAARLPPQVARQLEELAKPRPAPVKSTPAAGGAFDPNKPATPQEARAAATPADRRAMTRLVATLLGTTGTTAPGTLGTLGQAGVNLRKAIANTLSAAVGARTGPRMMTLNKAPDYGLDPFPPGTGNEQQEFGQVMFRHRMGGRARMLARVGAMGQQMQKRWADRLAHEKFWAERKKDVAEARPHVGDMIKTADDPAQSAAHGLDALTKVLPGPVGLLTKFGANLLEGGKALVQWNRSIFNANMQFAQFSPSMAGVAARQRMRDIMLSRERGERRAESAEYQARAMNRFEKQWAGIEDAFAKGWNYVSGGIANVLTTSLEGFKAAADKLFAKIELPENVKKALKEKGIDLDKDDARKAALKLKAGTTGKVTTIAAMARGRFEDYGKPGRF